MTSLITRCLTGLACHRSRRKQCSYYWSIEKKISTNLLHFIGINMRSNQDLNRLIKGTLYCNMLVWSLVVALNQRNFYWSLSILRRQLRDSHFFQICGTCCCIENHQNEECATILLKWMDFIGIPFEINHLQSQRNQTENRNNIELNRLFIPASAI